MQDMAVRLYCCDELDSMKFVTHLKMNKRFKVIQDHKISERLYMTLCMCHICQQKSKLDPSDHDKNL